MQKHEKELARFADLANATDCSSSLGFHGLEAPLRELATSRALAPILNLELRRIAADRDYACATWEPSGMLLCRNREWQLRIGTYDRTPDYIYSLPFDLIVAVVGPVDLDVERYRLSDLGVSHVQPMGISRLLPGTTLSLSASEDAVAIACEQSVVVLKLTSALRDPLQRAYCRKTHRLVQAIASDPTHSDLVSMARALGAMRNPSTSVSLERLADHDAHFVRWAAMQALARIDPERALKRLAAATLDPHPEVRNGAQRAVAMLEASRKERC